MISALCAVHTLYWVLIEVTLEYYYVHQTRNLALPGTKIFANKGLSADTGISLMHTSWCTIVCSAMDTIITLARSSRIQNKSKRKDGGNVADTGATTSDGADRDDEGDDDLALDDSLCAMLVQGKVISECIAILVVTQLICIVFSCSYFQLLF
jgi:hypothetical protein